MTDRPDAAQHHREVTGYDLSIPDIQFSLQLATRAWRTLQALRHS